MIEWKGLYANTPYSPANNKTQDDAVVGMQDTIYVTGPGYGGYSANVRVHNASGAVVALIPVSGGGGALSAPAPVRILDDSTTYSYSLEVVRGAVPSDDADKIVIRIVGGASKRYPGQVSTLPDGSISLAGPVISPPRLQYRQLDRLPRLATCGDSTADVGYGTKHNIEDLFVPFAGAPTSVGLYCTVATLLLRRPVSYVGNGGWSGQRLQQFIARSGNPESATRKALQDILALSPDLVQFHGGSINDYSAVTPTTTDAEILAIFNLHKLCVEFFTQAGVPVIDVGTFGYNGNGSLSTATMAAIRRAIVLSNGWIKEAAALNPLWKFIDLEGITHNAGTFLPGMSDDGTHLSPLGGYTLGSEEVKVFDSLFSSEREFLTATTYDATKVYFAAAGGQPANYNTDLWNASGISNVSTVDSYNATFSIDTAAPNGFRLILNAEPFAGLRFRDNAEAYFRFQLLDSTGAVVQFPVTFSIRLQFTDSTNAKVIYQDVQGSMCSGDSRFVVPFAMPCDSADLGSNSQLAFGFNHLPIGTYTLRLAPIKVRRRAQALSAPSVIFPSAPRHFGGPYATKAALQAQITKAAYPYLAIGDTATVRVNAFAPPDTYVWSKSPIDGSEFWAWDVLLKGGIIYCGRWRLSETYPNNTYKVYPATIVELDLPLASTANNAANPLTNSWQQREPVLPAEAILLGCPLRWSFFGAAPLDRTTERTFLNLYAGSRKLDVVDNFGSLLLAQNPAWAPVAGSSTAPLTVDGQITSVYQVPAGVPNWTTRAHNTAVTGGQAGGTTASSVPQSDFTSAATTFADNIVVDQVLSLKGKKTSNDGSNWVVDQLVLAVG